MGIIILLQMKLSALIALAAAVSMDKTVETPDVDADTLLQKMEPEQMEELLLGEGESPSAADEPASDENVEDEEEEDDDDDEDEKDPAQEEQDDAEATAA